MGTNLTRKILSAHLAKGVLNAGEEIAVQVDQTLTQDATGTMAYLQLEAMGVKRVKTKLSVSYVDHNMLQTGFENADDHRYLQTAAAKYGLYYSRPGNGICHQVHLERFSVPGEILIGADSHTPTSGGLGMLAIGAGGLEVAAAMAGMPMWITMPKIIGIQLTGKLSPWVAAKDIIFDLLRRLTVKSKGNNLIEYFGDGVATLSVPERATITNMGAELGATTSIFPSDDRTRDYLRSQKREESWQSLAADENADYDKVIEIDLSTLSPYVAKPQSPDNVVPITEVDGTPLSQVCVGSCTNSSYHDLAVVASIIKGKAIHPSVSMTVTPGSRQVLEMIAHTGILADFIQAGARILESACGPCIGMGQAPPSDGASLRTFNRNFPGRSGTPNDKVYLASPEVAAVSAINGSITDPRKWGAYPSTKTPTKMIVDDRLIIPPVPNTTSIEVVRGPNIKPLPLGKPPGNQIEAPILIKTGDNISTDAIMPAGAKILPLRSNIPAISDYVFHYLDKGFSERARESGNGIIIGGNNYGQGSSREHAALAPMYLGVRAVLALSFARMHHANLVNFGILPLIISNADYDQLEQDDSLVIENISLSLPKGKLKIYNTSKKTHFTANHQLTPRQVEIYSQGGLLNYVRDSQSN